MWYEWRELFAGLKFIDFDVPKKLYLTYNFVIFS